MDEFYNSVVEALIFASDDPISAAEIIEAIKGIDGEDTELSVSDVEKIVEQVNTKYGVEPFCFRIIQMAGGYSFATKPEYAKYIGYLSSEKSKKRLSQSALETLSIIAYKQPITKPDVESIRGVQCDYIIGTLLEKGLIAIAGRSESVGRPLLYGTTEEFLKYFALNTINDLPRPRELEEIINDDDIVEQRKNLLMGAVEEQFEFDIDKNDKTE